MMMMMTPTMMIKMTTMMMVMMITLTILSGTILRSCSLLITLRADPSRSDHKATGIAKLVYSAVQWDSSSSYLDSAGVVGSFQFLYSLKSASVFVWLLVA